MVALLQSKASMTGAATYDDDPTAGNLLVATMALRGVSTGLTLTGWTEVAHAGSSGYGSAMWWRAAPGGAVSVSPTGTIAGRRLVIMEYDVAASLVDTQTGGGGWPSPNGIDGIGTFSVGAVSLAGDGILVGIVAAGDPGGGHTNYTEDPDYTVVDEGATTNGLPPDSAVGYREVGAASWDRFPTGYTTGGGHPSWAGILAAFLITVPFTADFASNLRSGNPPLTVNFTDESFGGTGTPDTWLWDFGDGMTSTSQNPTHIYTGVGNYTVTLTVETDDAETDIEEKIAYIRVGAAYVPPEQSLAVIEIRAATPGSYRWGVAHWGESVWAAAAWQDVTPQSVDATVRWGSHNPEYGILAETEAASWLVDTYDPDRFLDPGNPDSPYAADLRAGLPIRIRHRGTIVRQGVCETIAYFHKDKRGGIRVTDNLSLMARTPVPEDSILSDTLRARARDVIAAAGLTLTVEPDPPSGDPALAPRLEGDRSVWRHIADAAQQTLNIAYIDRIGTIKFRPWATPYDRGRGVDETQLVDLGTIVQTRGLYSVVQAQQTVGDGGLLLERRLTPTPRYGSVTYSRTEETPDADAWADAVLEDRGLQGVQWIPGEIFPLTANDVEYFATLESVERFGVQHANTEPIVSVHGIIIGGEFRVTSKRDDSAIWSFELELAQTASTPLYTDTDPAEFLLNDFGDGYLYPG